MKLKLSEWTSVAEILSSLAVVITLIVLVLGIRANTEEMRAATRQSLASRAEADMLVRANAPELAQIIDKIEDREQLSAGEAYMYRGYLGAILRNAEEAFLQRQEG